MARLMCHDFELQKSVLLRCQFSANTPPKMPIPVEALSGFFVDIDKLTSNLDRNTEGLEESRQL